MKWEARKGASLVNRLAQTLRGPRAPIDRAAIGADFEARAAEFLRQRGVTVRVQNWRCRFGEIDLIAETGGVLLFVEVRRRNTTRFGGALASVDAHKAARWQRAASMYLAQINASPPCRFDVIAFEGETPEWIQGVDLT